MTRCRSLLPLLVLGLVAAAGAARGALPEDPNAVPAVRDFVAGGFGRAHAEAPAELAQFGRLVGIWRVEQELRRRDGEWAVGAPGLWAWRYTLGGFAVTDLWFQPADGLPVYMAGLGRDYLLSAVRIYEAASGRWRVAWMANGGGKTPGQDFGTFEAVADEGKIVMSSPAVEGAPLQRVVFEEITDSSFRWASEYSQDGGATWVRVLRMHARRVASGD